MKIRQTLQILLLIGAVLAAGCATRYRTRHPTPAEREAFAITALYEDTRVVATTNGVQRYVLVPDSGIVQSAETMLLYYSRSEDANVRGAAAVRLAHFGTRAALSRALELGHVEASPETRAGIWRSIAELLQPPLTWPPPQTVSNFDTNLASMLSSSDLRVVISCWHRPDDFIMPQDVAIETIESELISQYAADAGKWTVEVVDRIPLVPFSAHRRKVELTVRQSIADALQWAAQDNKHILAAFQDFARDQNEAVSAPARGVVEALSCTGHAL